MLISSRFEMKGVMGSERRSFFGREREAACDASGGIDASLLRANLWITAAFGTG
jgi:hypothetical protein